MDSKDNVFSKGTSKPGRYGSLGNTDMASIKKLLAEDLGEELVETRRLQKDSGGVDTKPIKEASPESSDGNDKADLGESLGQVSGTEGEGRGDAKNLQRLNVEVDATLHSQFKAMVGMRKTTMRQVVESFMHRYVDEVKEEFFSGK